jgi:hypothetical protein
VTTNSASDRVGDKLALTITRFRDANDSPLWRLKVSRYIGTDVLHEEDASIETLTAIKRWAERSIKIVSTDGDRKTEA